MSARDDGYVLSRIEEQNIEYRIQTIDEILSLQRKLIVISKCVKFHEYFSGKDFIGLTFTNYTETNHKEIEFEKKASTDFHCRVFP